MKISRINRTIDDLIDLWHESPEIELPLHLFLGMSWSEYSAWIQDSTQLPVGHLV